MDFRQTFQSATNRSDDSATPAPAHTQAHEGGPKRQKQGKPDLNLQNLFSVGLLVATALLVFFLVLSFLTRGNVTGEEKFVDTKKYQAVFLSNGQVYFGKLKVLNDKYYELSDIYYVRVEQVQPDKNNAQAQPQQNISLAKLGNEIHGPQDFMYINRDSIMFFENLKDDGQVVKAITEYKKNPTQNNNQQNNNTNTNNNNTPAPNTNN